MLKVDREDMPRIIQRIRFIYSSYYIEITLFNGKKVLIDPDRLMKYPPDLLQAKLSPEQLQDLYQVANEQEWEIMRSAA